MMYKSLFTVVGLALSTAAVAQHELRQGTIDPNGIFFNRFSGSINGTEWFQTFPISGTDRYRVADIFGGGFNATITPDGIITLDNSAGGGSFDGPDEYELTPTIGGSTFTFLCNRVPLTTPDFPLMLEDSRPSNLLLSGAWINDQERIDPETGAVTSLGQEIQTLTQGATTLRLTDPGGMFFQGVYENGNTVVFRLVDPNPSDPRFASIPGTAISVQQNFLGVVRFSDINTFEGLFLLQSRAPLGSQSQIFIRYSATRMVPLAMGDIDGDGFVDNIDRDLLVAQIGLTVEDDGYNLAADLDHDDDVDNMDLALFDSGEVIFATGFENKNRGHGRLNSEV